MTRKVAALAMIAALWGCGDRHDRGPVRIDVIGTAAEMAEPFHNANRPVSQVMLNATAQGLVAFGASGDLVGGLAERWIVEDDGQSYIFRLKPARWADGSPVKAQEVARLLHARMVAMPDLLAGLDPQVRGMTDFVVEIRLPGPMPSFLQLLAQPGMAIARPTGGTGPFRKTVHHGLAILTPIRGPDDADADSATPEAPARRLYLRAVRSALGFVRFQRHDSDLLMGARFQDLPYVALTSPPDNAVRADPVNGLFGLVMEPGNPLLDNGDVREAMNMAVDRDRLSTLLNLAGWQTTTTILPATLDLGHAPTPAHWAEQNVAQRKGYARSVIATWSGQNGGPPKPLRIALPAGPGARLLFVSLARDFNDIGLSVVLVGWTAEADLRLIDQVAPFDSALWYLGRVGCPVNRLCSADARAKLDAAMQADDDGPRAAALGAAETLTLGFNNYIPIGMPVRFALVRNRLTGYQPSPRARHPLNALFQPPK